MPFCDDVALQGDIGRVLIDRRWHAIRDDGIETPASAAFIDSSNEASCFVIAETDLNLLAAKFPNKSLGVVTTMAAREAGYIIARDPEGGDGIPGHVVLIQVAARPGSNHHTRLARMLARSGRVVKLPEP